MRDYGGDVAQASDHLLVPPARVRAALNYAKAFPEEIEADIEDNECTWEEFKRLVRDRQVVDRDALIV